MTKITQIVDRIVSLIDTARPPGIPQPQRERTFAIDPGTLPIMNVHALHTVPVIDPATAHQVATLDPMIVLATTVAVDCASKGDQTTRPQQAVDAMIAWVWKTCVGQVETSSIDPSLRLFLQIQLGSVTPNMDQADHPYEMTRLELVVFHQTGLSDPETWA